MRYKVRGRDRFVNRFCNWVINTFATKEYRAFLYLTYKYGKMELDRRVREGEI